MDLRIEYADTDYGRRRHPELGACGTTTEPIPVACATGVSVGASYGEQTGRTFCAEHQIPDRHSAAGRELPTFRSGIAASQCMRKSEAAVDLTWWYSKDIQVMGVHLSAFDESGTGVGHYAVC